MKTFSFRVTDIRSDAIERAAGLEGKSPAAWLARVAVLTAYGQCDKERVLRREAERRSSKVIPFPRRAFAQPDRQVRSTETGASS